MTNTKEYDWAQGTAEAHLEFARAATPEDLRAIARRYDWRLFPEEVLNWIMAQKYIDLGSALTCFLNGGPERFNYLPKRDVPDQYRGFCRLLDNICLRVNSGFYLVVTGSDVAQAKRLQSWLRYQQEDRDDGTKGRWILDERIIDTLRAETLKLPANAAAAPRRDKVSLLRDVLEPVANLGVDREHLKYLPEGSKGI